MTSTTEELALRTAAFTDLEARAVYCDWLEERGDDRERFWQWALKGEYKPNTYWSNRRDGTDWGNENRRGRSWYGDKPECNNCWIPEQLHSAIGHIAYSYTSTWCCFNTPKDAWLALETVWLEAHPK